MGVAGPKETTLQVAELVEQEERVIAGAAEVAIPVSAFLLAVGRALGTVHVENDAVRRPPFMHLVDPGARQTRQHGQVALGRQHSVSKRPIWLLDAAARSSPSRPTIARMAGSRASRSASLTSSYPASRPNTDCRNSPPNV